MLFKREISLENVAFKYESSSVESLRGVSLIIPHGSTIGFIGTTGAGKSTLVDIILGLLTPVTGIVKVDGNDIQTNLRAWQNKIGYVPQSIFLTDDTLRRNIAFGISKNEIDETSIQRAIESAQLSDYVKSLPLGLDTIVGERGIRLSGGQRQRIGIARALYHDPSVLVLDEATSSLDNATEKSVMEAIKKLHGYKTIIIIAHRLSTVEHCDRIFKLEFGKIVDEGKMVKTVKN
jgi:ABC-type bacteriocin/lantibiotic exporter with double-glycine peptidase domain